MRSTAPTLAIFDLDHTLIQGDTDTLWCEYLLARGLLPARFAQENQRLETQYRAGAISPAEFSTFYAQTLAAFETPQVHALRNEFTAQVIVPRIKPGASDLLAKHRNCGDLLLLSSATSRFLITLTAQQLGFEHLLGTELEMDANGHFTGRTQGVLNMREGKVSRLQSWLAEQGWADAPQIWTQACFYSDSINDLPLLQAVGKPVAVDPDPLLYQTAMDHQWPILRLS